MNQAARTEKTPNIKIRIENARFSYAHVYKPQAAVDGGDPKYSVSILIPKSAKDDIKRIQEAIKATATANAHVWNGRVPADLRNPLRDGDIDKPNYPEYAGHYFINASSKQMPGVVGPDGRTPVEYLVSGDYGRVTVQFYAYNRAGNKGVGCGLQNIQWLREGEPLGGGRSKPEDDFDAVETENLWD